MIKSKGGVRGFGSTHTVRMSASSRGKMYGLGRLRGQAGQRGRAVAPVPSATPVAPGSGEWPGGRQRVAEWAAGGGRVGSRVTRDVAKRQQGGLGAPA